MMQCQKNTQTVVVNILNYYKDFNQKFNHAYVDRNKIEYLLVSKITVHGLLAVGLFVVGQFAVKKW